MRRLTFAVTIWALSALVAVACGTENESVFDPNGDGGGSSGDPGIIGNAEGGPGSPQGEPISLEPADPVVTFTVGQAAPSVTFTAKTASGVKVPATFAIDRGELTISLTFAKGGNAYGPITETWKVASGPLKGTVYYNSYGTCLAKNFTGAKGGDGRFGGATLAVRGGSTDPTLVACGDGSCARTRCRSAPRSSRSARRTPTAATALPSPA